MAYHITIKKCGSGSSAASNCGHNGISSAPAGGGQIMLFTRDAQLGHVLSEITRSEFPNRNTATDVLRFKTSLTVEEVELKLRRH